MYAFAPADNFLNAFNFGRSDSSIFTRTCESFRSLPSGFCSGTRCRDRKAHPKGAPLYEASLLLELVTDRAEFDALAEEWEGLYDRSEAFSNPFLSFGWCWNWCNHFLGEGSGTELCILTGRRFGRLVMVWPMVRQRVFGMTNLTWLGAPVSQYGDVLIETSSDDLELLEMGWDYLRGNVSADFISLGRVRADGAIAPLLKKLGVQVTREDAAPYVDLASADSFDAYAERYSSRHRKKRRRSLRQLEEKGAIDHAFHYDGEGARGLAEQIIAMKHRWLKEKGIVSSGLSDPRTTAFFADVAEGVGGYSTGCRVLALTCNDELVAGEISFASKDNVSGHVVVFNSEYEKQSPGLLMTEDNLRLCKEFGYGRYDFMGPCEQHKLDWADDVVAVNDYAKASSLRGYLWVNGYLSWGRPRLKKLVNSIPPDVRARVAKLHPALSRFA